VTDVPPPPDNVGPTASLTASTTTPANGADVTLNAGGSVDTDGTIADYAWDLDGDLTFETPGGTVPTLVHAFTTPGPVTVRVLVTDNAGGTGGASVTLNVAAPTPADPPAQQAPPPAEQTPPASQPAPPAPGPSITQPTIVPIALTANSAPPPARPAFSAPAGQHLKRQKGVKVGVSCPAGCQVVLSGNVKVGGRTLKLKQLTRSVGAGKPATLTLLVADAKALRKARGKARASIKADVTVGGQTSAQNVAVSLTS
jgi:hypothetical protein